MAQQNNVHSLDRIAQNLGISRTAVLNAAARAGIIGATVDKPGLDVYFNDTEFALINEKASRR